MIQRSPEIFTPSVVMVLALCASAQLIGFQNPVHAEFRNGSPQAQAVNWSTLDLSTEQNSNIQQLESEWRQTYSDVYPRIVQDQQEMRRILNSTAPDGERLMILQNRVSENEQKLRQEAMRIFLNKKEQLTPGQKQKLQQQMMSP